MSWYTGVRSGVAEKEPPQPSVSDQICSLIKRSSIDDWERGHRQLVYKPDRRIWFYLDYQAWIQGSVNIGTGKSHFALCDLYDEIGRIGSQAASAALLAASQE